MLNDHRDGLSWGLTQISSGQRPLGPQRVAAEGGLTIEEYLRLVISQVHDEMDRVKEDFASEIQRSARHATHS